MAEQELPPESSESSDLPIQGPTAEDDNHLVESVDDESIDPAHSSDSPAVKDSPGTSGGWHGFNN
jgi:hypothetical protein